MTLALATKGGIGKITSVQASVTPLDIEIAPAIEIDFVISEPLALDVNQVGSIALDFELESPAEIDVILNVVTDLDITQAGVIELDIEIQT